MRWRDSKASSNIQDVRGRSYGGRGMKFGLGGIIAVVAGYFLGIDPRMIMGILDATQGGSQSAPQVPAGTPTDEGGQFVAHVLGDTEVTWSQIFSSAGQQYPAPQLVLFSQGVNTGCGSATSAAGPFYCPADRQVYIDLAFFQQLETDFAAQGDFAKAYVIAHEVGHHVQTVLGTSEQVRAAQGQASEAEANALQVKMELQADCYAGVWAHHADSGRQLVEAGDIDEALGAAAAVGDDTIQKRVQGRVNQESFTHGSGAQRMEWFRKGYGSGLVQDCNTFK